MVVGETVRGSGVIVETIVKREMGTKRGICLPISVKSKKIKEFT